MFTRFMLTAATSALIAGSAAADYTLTILHTNDIHSRVESINKYDQPVTPMARRGNVSVVWRV